ncbi:MAG: RNA methyltransferase [Gammaproteobacteria bacterium]|nr:RNA methyltransferase [Gammaproteobacteria bacterium]
MTKFPVRFVLFEPTHPGNVGAAARALKTMGFNELVLVNPKCEINGVARARSSGALDVLLAARVVTTLEAAIEGCGFVVGTSARRRRLTWPEFDPRECAAEVVAASAVRPAAIVFGAERAGLTNAEMDRCSALVYIPSNPEYSSLNLAMAVQILAYEVRFALGSSEKPVDSESIPADVADVERFYAHLEKVLLNRGFLKSAQPHALMRRLRRLFNRARLDVKELNIMRGILTALAPDVVPDSSPPEDRDVAE